MSPTGKGSRPHASAEWVLEMVQEFLQEKRLDTGLDAIRAEPEQHPTALLLFNRNADKVMALVIHEGKGDGEKGR